jgi:hypothetical protein
VGPELPDTVLLGESLWCAYGVRINTGRDAVKNIGTYLARSINQGINNQAVKLASTKPTRKARPNTVESELKGVRGYMAGA